MGRLPECAATSPQFWQGLELYNNSPGCYIPNVTRLAFSERWQFCEHREAINCVFVGQSEYDIDVENIHHEATPYEYHLPPGMVFPSITEAMHIISATRKPIPVWDLWPWLHCPCYQKLCHSSPPTVMGAPWGLWNKQILLHFVPQLWHRAGHPRD